MTIGLFLRITFSGATDADGPCAREILEKLVFYWIEYDEWLWR